MRSSPLAPAVLLLLGLGGAGCSSASSTGCTTDADGITGGDDTFDLAVSDTGFSKRVLAAQNLAHVTLTLKNEGSKPHGFTIECLATPSSPPGCPTKSCFPKASTIPALAPGKSATVTFETPNPEGAYPFTSPGERGEAFQGQFIVM